MNMTASSNDLLA